MWINKHLTFHISAEGEKSKHEYYISKSSVTKENVMSEITICVPVIKRVLCKIFPFFYWSIQLLLVLQLSIKHSNSCSFPHVCNSTLSSAAKFHGLKGLILGIGQDFHCFFVIKNYHLALQANPWIPQQMSKVWMLIILVTHWSQQCSQCM